MKYNTHCGKGQAKDTQSTKNAVVSMETKQNEETDSIELYF